MNNKVQPDAAYPPPPPPAYGMPPAASQPGTAPPPPPYYPVVMTQPGAALSSGLVRYSEYPASVVCQFCGATITTSTTYTVGTSAFVVCFILWFVGLGLGCCLIPFCMDSCKDVVHSCPNCKATVGRFSRM